MDERAKQGFDGKAAWFQMRIYGNRKGALRLALLWEQLLRHVPALAADQPLQILDLGAGIGQLSARLAAKGHKLTLVDASHEMLTLAREHFQSEGLTLEQAAVHCAALDAVPALGLPQQDLVLCHAVLEWLPDPREGIAVAAACVKAGGYLSLAYYNRHGLVYRNLLHGNFERIQQENYSGHPGGLTPVHSLIPDELESWLQPLGLQPVYRAGLRTFSDFMAREVVDKYNFEQILEMERRFAEQEPYRSLGRYQHLLCRKL